MSAPSGRPARAARRHLERIARHLTIMDRLTSARMPWVPNEDQLRLWSLCEDHRAVVVAKPRKIGFSTAMLLTDVVETAAADAEGHAFICVVAIDTDDKAKRLGAQVRDFVRQLGLGARHNEHGVKFRNGSEIICATAGGFLPGRGTTIHRLHVTELPFWRQPRETYNALRSSCADDATIIIETTMDVASDNFPRDMWRGFARDEESGRQIEVAPEFHRQFFTVEDHASYRSDEPITDDEWKRCQGEGFTDRRAAAWWLKHALPNLCGGDEARLLHDYPQHERHLFAGAAGRVITTTPEVAPVVDRVLTHGVGGKVWVLEVYVRPEHTSGHLFVPVDTAWGKGPKASRSAVFVLDREDARVCASLVSPFIMYDDLAPVAQMAKHHYSEGGGKSMRGIERKVDILVEINGSGNAVARELDKVGEPYVTIDQTDDGYGPDECIKAAKRLIEQMHQGDHCERHKEHDATCQVCSLLAARAGKSIVAGPPELAEECDNLRRERNEYVGLKDCLMTLGMALIKRRELGLRDDRWRAKRYDINVIHVEDRMKAEKRAARDRLPRFGRRV